VAFKIGIWQEGVTTHKLHASKGTLMQELGVEHFRCGDLFNAWDMLGYHPGYLVGKAPKRLKFTPQID
jgi:hypothetical protein